MSRGPIIRGEDRPHGFVRTPFNPMPAQGNAAPILSPTLTGLVDLRNPDPATITVEALARGLCRPRWANATELPITIAQHSVLVMELFIRRNPALRHAAIYPLLHDAHEYLLGDLITPTLRLLAEDLPGLPARIDRHKGRIDDAIRLAFGVPAPGVDIIALVHEADQAAAHVEWISLIPSVNGLSPFTTPRKSLFRLPTIKPLAWPQAEALFRETLERELATRPWEIEEQRTAAERDRHYDRDGYCDSPYRGY